MDFTTGIVQGNLRADAEYAEGLSCALSGQNEDAVRLLSGTVLRLPGAAEAHNNLGLVLQKLGDFEGAIACFRRAVIVRPNYAKAWNNLGAALAGLGRNEEAVGVYERALTIDAGDPTAMNNLGAALHSVGRSDEALVWLRAGAAATGDDADIQINLGNVLSDVGTPEAAITHYRSAIEIRPDDGTAHLKLGCAFHKADRHLEARRHLEAARHLEPATSEAHYQLGRVLQELGHIQEARESFRVAIELNPKRSAYLLDLAHITKLNRGDADFQKILDLADESAALPPEEAANVHFALGKAYLDMGDQETAVAEFAQANALKRRRTAYEEQPALENLRRLRAVFNLEYMRRWPEGHPSETPIFIVGMPRSGSTLVEQILAGHPAVRGAGETNLLRSTLQDVHTIEEPWNSLKPGFLPSRHRLLAIADRYLEGLEALASASSGTKYSKITNKMLSNFRFIGLIKLIFPNAKIIHTFRDPIETCMSCFSINFTNQPFAFDLGELGRYYRSYAATMRHWRASLPAGSYLDVRYEAVVHDVESSARAIIAYCGLDWDERCLDFHNVQRPVRTASLEQVRRPIYNTSVRRWRRDLPALRPLAEGLGMSWPLD